MDTEKVSGIAGEYGKSEDAALKSCVDLLCFLLPPKSNT